jgi:hypothetical protein
VTTLPTGNEKVGKAHSFPGGGGRRRRRRRGEREKKTINWSTPCVSAATDLSFAYA